MSVTYEEAERFEFHGIHYEATPHQANDVYIGVSATPQGIEFRSIDLQLDSIRTESPTPELEALCRRKAELEVELARLTLFEVSRVKHEADSE